MFSRANVLSKLRLSEYLNRHFESTDSKTMKSLNHLFIDKRVQTLLKKITNIDYEKVFRPRRYLKGPEAPKYKLLTTEELEEELITFRNKADYLLQMPPVVDLREDINEVLSVDPDLDGHDKHHCNYVFTDTSFDTNSRTRTIVVREPNGVLRKANWEERSRMNQIYDPIPGKEIKCPKMFEDENLLDVLNREEYEFILDRACVQFEPDEPLYHKITKMTYERINLNNHFSKLHSTRHFGGLAFYLLKNKKIDNMLIDNIKSERIEDAYNLVKLYHIIHPECESAKLNETNEMNILKAFIEMDSENKVGLKMILQKYEDKQEEKKNIKMNLQKAHGVS